MLFHIFCPLAISNLILVLYYKIESISALLETASIHVNISSPDIQNGSSISMTATFDPTVGNSSLSDVICQYTQPGGGTPNTPLTTYHIGFKQITPHADITASGSARLTIVSPFDPMVLTIVPITFEDEKRQFFCTLEYYIGLSVFRIRSERHILENVYSKLLIQLFIPIIVLIHYDFCSSFRIS